MCRGFESLSRYRNKHCHSPFTGGQRMLCLLCVGPPSTRGVGQDGLIRLKGELF